MASGHNSITEGRLTFTFLDETTKVCKYDDWSFYRNQFNAAFGGTKAVDIIVLAAKTTWLVEVKDYRAHPRSKTVDLGKEVAFKVRDTLAGLAAAKCNAAEPEEKQFAKNALQSSKIRVVLHLEQPIKSSKLFPRINVLDVRIKLKQWIKAVDAHPAVVDSRSLKTDMCWVVEG